MRTEIGISVSGPDRADLRQAISAKLVAMGCRKLRHFRFSVDDVWNGPKAAEVVSVIYGVVVGFDAKLVSLSIQSRLAKVELRMVNGRGI